ncbi:hypothetical protein [Jannaschia seohaensis]|uniref:Uncharacterized protein n=1 Tax=Jannaschia seohaensis TaxID=475081 RepID=A0A2Y9AA77_9RHOB|nr:hypothetical protein [Jannaschia seohaensis]PWJ21051.1 hypothetical protein BCF38_102299 [Jannaschia seohaensis]SSA41461.1 hypothetical protein SAMN05421539_102299 [Jannaschia seohaensis]
MKFALTLMLLPCAPGAAPVVPPKIQGLPITEPAVPPSPPCLRADCPTRT